MTEVAARAAALVGGTFVAVDRLPGGSLSEVVRLRLADGRALIAKHAPSAGAEAEMLRAIAATGAPAPDVIAVADDLLVMQEIVADGRLAGAAWDRLVDALTCLHAPTKAAYGWARDHAFGRVAIANAPTDDWARFWAERRLLCHGPHVEGTLARRLEQLAGCIHDVLPTRPKPALLHGDLWGGNVLVAGQSVHLIDPACYVGHREADIAMLTLFDAPPESFFAALALDAGWRERLPIYRLWPLLVHLRLFGDAYRGSVEGALGQLGL